jgi:hypothetical protein
MLPFTTYTIPETPANETASAGKWLLFIADQEFSSSQKELIQKIGAAVKADFDRDTFSRNMQSGTNASIQDLMHPSLQLVISFGMVPRSLGLWIDLQSPGIRFLESFSFILTLPVSELEKNAAAKKELWKNMQLFMEMNERQHG